MEIISQDYETYVENCKASSNIILSECEYQAANVSHRGYLDKEVADILRKSVQTISSQLKTAKQRLGINKNVELTWYMQCVAFRKNFDINEIRKHGVAVFFSVWFFVLAVTPDYQMDMRRCNIRPAAKTVLRMMRTKMDGDLMLSA